MLGNSGIEGLNEGKISKTARADYKAMLFVRKVISTWERHLLLRNRHFFTFHSNQVKLISYGPSRPLGDLSSPQNETRFMLHHIFSNVLFLLVASTICNPMDVSWNMSLALVNSIIVRWDCTWISVGNNCKAHILG